MMRTFAAVAVLALTGGSALAAYGSVAASAPASADAASAPAVPAPAPAEPRVTVTRTTTADGSLVTVATFPSDVRYVLHDGSEDPYVPPGQVRAGPVIHHSERTHLLAAFNGGFKMVADAGGYEQEGHVIEPLRDGLASLVISRSGRARIEVWEHGAPAGEQVYSVRQNLQPLVLDGKPTAAAYDWSRWGATLGGGEYVARSAVGQAADGDLIYAGSMSATPEDLAYALASSGARIAMELDINPAWVQLDVASKPGGVLRAEVYGQNRPADQYLYGWTRDFFTVVAVRAPGGGGRSAPAKATPAGAAPTESVPAPPAPAGSAPAGSAERAWRGTGP
jgi:Phosphodiester glycosidase